MLMPVSVPPLWAWSVKSWLIQQSLGATSIFGTRERTGRRQRSLESTAGGGSAASSMVIRESSAVDPFFSLLVALCAGLSWRITNLHSGCGGLGSWRTSTSLYGRRTGVGARAGCFGRWRVGSSFSRSSMQGFRQNTWPASTGTSVRITAAAWFPGLQMDEALAHGQSGTPNSAAGFQTAWRELVAM